MQLMSVLPGAAPMRGFPPAMVSCLCKAVLDNVPPCAPVCTERHVELSSPYVIVSC